MKIYFARHGESQANVLHEISNRGLVHGLTRMGFAQALQLAGRLEGRPVVRIFSSPLLRAVETSLLISDRLGVQFETADALREFDCGILEGHSDEAAWKAYDELVEAWLKHNRQARRFEGGESLVDIRKRFRPFIDSLVLQYGKRDVGIVCVSHGGLYRLMLPELLKNPGIESVLANGFDMAACLEVESRPEGLFALGWLERSGKSPG